MIASICASRSDETATDSGRATGTCADTHCASSKTERMRCRQVIEAIDPERAFLTQRRRAQRSQRGAAASLREKSLFVCLQLNSRPARIQPRQRDRQFPNYVNLAHQRARHRLLQARQITVSHEIRAQSGKALE